MAPDDVVGTRILHQNGSFRRTDTQCSILLVVVSVIVAVDVVFVNAVVLM